LEAPQTRNSQKVGGKFEGMSIAKIDVDVKMDERLLYKWIITREAIIRRLGYTLVDWKMRKTKKGYHFWLYFREKLTDKELCDLQFLLGDDQVRSKFNFLRLEAGAFNQFNVLFSRKYKKLE
jgi:hypothetical protein